MMARGSSVAASCRTSSEFASSGPGRRIGKSCVVERERLAVARGTEMQLGVDSGNVALDRARVILIARPDEGRLETMSRDDLLRYYWRILYHARIDLGTGYDHRFGRAVCRWPTCGGGLPSWARPSSTRFDQCLAVGADAAEA